MNPGTGNYSMTFVEITFYNRVTKHCRITACLHFDDYVRTHLLIATVVKLVKRNVIRTCALRNHRKTNQLFQFMDYYTCS